MAENRSEKIKELEQLAKGFRIDIIDMNNIPLEKTVEMMSMRSAKEVSKSLIFRMVGK